MNQIEKLLADIPFEYSKLILTNTFSLQSQKDLPVILELYKQGLKIKYINNTEKWLFFDFEIKFTILRKKKENPEQQHLPDPYGLKFERSPNHQELIVYSQQIPLLLQWRDQLCKLINQRGFHDLYKPFRKIGKGNSATVYLAQRIEDKNKVAIKAFGKQPISHQTKGKESLINEINIMRYFNHDSLMKLHEVFETDNSFYLVIQHLDGGQLFQKLNSRRFNLKEIQQILLALSQGLVEMHKNRIIHRDLKPQNLIFRHQNDYKSIVIADYGLATKEDQQQYIFVRCGTPGYVAPQIISFKGKTGQSTISDIFSLGIIAHILSTGRSPFSGKKYLDILNQNKQANFNFDLEIYKHVDPILLDLIKQMMKVNPQQRIKTEEILNHQFFKMDITEQIIANQQFTSDLPHEKNNKKGIQILLDSNGSFIVPRPQILPGNQEQYVSMNHVGSSSSVSCSPQSIKMSAFLPVKRQRQPTSPFDTQFKVGNRKAIGRNRIPQLMQNKQKRTQLDKKQIQQEKKETAQDIKSKQKIRQQDMI